jgi:hypothetical protein
MTEHYQHDHSEPEARSQMQRIAREHQNAIWGAQQSDSSGSPSATERRTGIPGLGLLAGDIGPKSEIGGQLRNLSLEQRRTRGRVAGGSPIPGAGLLMAATFGTIICAAGAALALIAWLVS